MPSRGFAKPGQTVFEVLKSKVSAEYNKWEVKKMLYSLHCIFKALYELVIQTLSFSKTILSTHRFLD